MLVFFYTVLLQGLYRVLCHNVRPTEGASVNEVYMCMHGGSQTIDTIIHSFSSSKFSSKIICVN